MKEKIEGIVLGRVKHSDRSDIITLYTRRRGRMSFVTPALAARKKPSASILLPMTVVEAWITPNPNRELLHLGSTTPIETFPNLYADPVKGTITLFLSEFLSKLLRVSAPDELLYAFLRSSLIKLNEAGEGLQNFTLVFLSGLTRFVGIMPDISEYGEGMHFDMRAGVFAPFEPRHNDCLTGDDASIPVSLFNMDFNNMNAPEMNINERRRMLDVLLRYYAIHTPGMGELKSVDVLRQVFS